MRVFSRTLLGVRQGSPYRLYCSTSLSRISGNKTLHDHPASISISCRPICGRRFAHDVNLMTITDSYTQDLMNRLTLHIQWRPGLSRSKSWLPSSARAMQRIMLLLQQKLYHEFIINFLKELHFLPVHHIQFRTAVLHCQGYLCRFCQLL